MELNVRVEELTTKGWKVFSLRELKGEWIYLILPKDTMLC
jgi:hypothetical protein